MCGGGWEVGGLVLVEGRRCGGWDGRPQGRGETGPVEWPRLGKRKCPHKMLSFHRPETVRLPPHKVQGNKEVRKPAARPPAPHYPPTPREGIAPTPSWPGGAGEAGGTRKGQKSLPFTWERGGDGVTAWQKQLAPAVGCLCVPPSLPLSLASLPSPVTHPGMAVSLPVWAVRENHVDLPSL